MITRIYLVRNEQTGGDSLIRANSQAQAVKTAAKSLFTCRVASQEEIVQSLTHGVKVIDAGVENE